MDEREFFDERPEPRTHMLTCPHCGQSGEYSLQWLVRRKRAQCPRGADERDRARFAKAHSYMVRRDDTANCTNVRCRKRFDVAGLQSVADLIDTSVLPKDHAEKPAAVQVDDRAARLRAAFSRRNGG
jgi:hypothetical protein